jgi:hypothetical protein
MSINIQKAIASPIQLETLADKRMSKESSDTNQNLSFVYSVETCLKNVDSLKEIQDAKTNNNESTES